MSGPETGRIDSIPLPPKPADLVGDLSRHRKCALIAAVLALACGLLGYAVGRAVEPPSLQLHEGG